MVDSVYKLNMASRRLQRRIKEKDLEQANNLFIERIVRIKTHHSLLGGETMLVEQSRTRKRKSRSVFLPPIADVESG
jgi:hypothetical protein